MSIPRRLISKLDEVFHGDKDFSRSPLRHLSKSNATPSDSEVIVIRALITKAEASIEELHRRFPTRLDHASQVIESQLLKTIEAHRALLSPVRYLPSEILQEIFLHYADSQGPNVTIGKMPWRLGHISHRWRKIALSFPSLWDSMPTIYLNNPELISKSVIKRYTRVLIYLLRRSGTSPTLKLKIIPRPGCHGKDYDSIIKEIMLHSERIEWLCIRVNETTMPLLQGLKGRLPNLRILRVLYYALDAPNINVFETAPALRQVAVGRYSGVRVLLPWSQITHFEEAASGRVGKLGLLPSSSLHSLTNLDIHRFCQVVGESALLSPYRPTILPNLRTLSVLVQKCDYKDLDFFLESLTIPAVEVMKIRCMEPLIPHLVSMFSGSRGPSRLQKLAFRTIPLQTGELSALLKLTPHLVELDIDVPPAGDLLRLIYSEGEGILVPVLQALYMHIPELTTAQIEHLDTLALVRCELGIPKGSEDATMLSLRPTGTWTTLHILRVSFDSAESRDSSQKILNNWSSSFTLEEANVIDRLRLERNLKSYYSRNGSSVKNILSFIECYQKNITSKVLRVGEFFWMLACRMFTLIFFIFNILQETNLHIELRDHFMGDLMNVPDEDKLKQRVMEILVEWHQLLLNDFSGGRWARTSSAWYNSSLVYVSKSKYHGERYVLAQTVGSPNTPFLDSYRIANVSRCGT